MVDIVRRIDIQAKATGVAPVVAELNTLTAAQKRLGDTSEASGQQVAEAGGASLAVANKFRTLRYSLDEAWRASEKFKQQQNTLKLALKEGAATQEEYNRVLDLLTRKYAAVTDAANKAASAQRQFAAASAPTGKGGITQRTMTPSSSLEAAAMTASAAERSFQSMTISGSAGAAGAISQRTMAVNQLGAATNTAANTERSFQAMTIAGSAGVVGSISQRTMAVNQLTAATNAAIATQRQFQAMTIAGAAGPQGRITGSATGFQSRAPADVEKTAQVLPKATADMTKLGASTKLTAFEVTNLGMQFNDIAVMAASGQNPMVLIMQQGMQLAQIMAMSSVATAGLKGTLVALGGAVVTFLTNPFYLTVAAAAALAGAIVYLWDSFESGAPDAEESLKRHEDLLERVEKAYGKATIEAVRLHEAASGALFTFQAQTNVLEAQGQVLNALAATIRGIQAAWGDLNLGMLEVQRQQQRIFNPGGTPAAGSPRAAQDIRDPEADRAARTTEMFIELVKMTTEFNKDAEDGIELTEQWTERFVDFGKNAPADVRAAVVTVLDLIEVLDQANKRLLEATRLREHLLRLRAGEYIDPFAPTGRQAEQAGMQALNKQLGIDPDKAIADRLADEARAQEDYARATQIALDAAARESDTVAELIDQLRFEQAIMKLNAEEKAVANAIRQAGAAATDAERQAIDELTRSLFRQAEAEKAAEEAARKAKQAADEAARKAKQAADVAAREAERKQDFIEQLRFEHEIMDMLEEDQAVANNLRQLGADAAAGQKTEVEALTRSMEQYKEAVKAAEEADKKAMQAWEDARDAAIEKMDEFRDSAKGILSAFIEGGPTAALEAFASRLTSLGEDLMISGLFGEQGAAGGGIFGDAIQNLLGGVPDKPVATMNVVAGVVNVGGAGVGGFITGTSPIGAMPGGMGTGGPGQSGMIAGVPVDTWAQEASAAAQRAGIDPATFLAVLRSEGLQGGTWQSNVYKNGVRETSYGPGQLLVGGGLGDTFQQQTGLDLANQAAFQDPMARQQYLDFMTAQARQSGWGAWYGAANTGIGNWQGINQNAPLTTAAATAAPAVDALNNSINVLEQSANQVVPGMGSLASSIVNLIPGGGGGIPTPSAEAMAAMAAAPFGGFWAEGGTLGAGKWGIAGEAGPEIIHGPANITPMRGGGRGPVNINVTNIGDARANVRNVQQRDDGGFDVEVFAESIKRDIRDTYGLREPTQRWGRA